MQPSGNILHLTDESLKMTLNINKSTSQDKLIQRCLEQDIRGQRELYEQYSAKMLGVCLRYIKDRGEAEGVMVGGFMKVFEKISQYERKGSFEGWIRRIMVNEALTYIRKHKSMSVEVEIEKADREPDFSYLSDSLEEMDLLRMIQDLPIGYRTVFNMYAIEGYSHKEIGEMLGISANTSKSQLSRARNWLQEKLKSHEKELKTNYKSHE
jgi:RNA polymerase sigma-70 factor (ECF subfamily)